jgi:protein transport protein SEC24
VVENGLVLYLWVGRQVVPALVVDLFGVESQEEIDAQMVRISTLPNPQHELPVIETEINHRARTLIDQIQSERGRYCQLQIVRHQCDAAMEAEFAGLMVEDKNMDNMDYVDYLCFVHRHIQLELQQR